MNRTLLLLSFFLSADDADRQALNEKHHAELSEKVLNAKDVDRESAILMLRQAGPDAFNYFLRAAEEKQSKPDLFPRDLRPNLQQVSTNKKMFAKPTLLSPTANRPAENSLPPALDDVIDAVAGQKYAWRSKLFWYTTESEAKDRARHEHKPIVSLRLLGKLTDERSCANSRFFRTLLYPDPDVQTLLKNNAVLYWESVRDVPRITIELRPGEMIEQTITGNSIHYVLDEKGRLVDAIPGLYAPKEFAAVLKQALDLAQQAAPLNDSEFRRLIVATHSARIQQSEKKLLAKLEEIKGRSTIARLIVHSPEKLTVDQIIPLLTPDAWVRMAEVRKADFAPEAVNAIKAGRKAIGKFGIERPMLKLLASLEPSVAADTLQNELSLRRAISTRLVVTPLIQDFTSFNNWVYADVFLTPLTDQTMGLGNPNRFAALPNNGWAN